MCHPVLICQAIGAVVDSDLNAFLAKAAGGLLTREEYTVGEIGWFCCVQGDHSGCAKPPVDFKTKVPF